MIEPTVETVDLTPLLDNVQSLDIRIQNLEVIADTAAKTEGFLLTVLIGLFIGYLLVKGVVDAWGTSRLK